MRVALVENTQLTHHGQIGVALHEAGARIGLYKPWRDGALPDLGGYDALVVFGGEQNALADATHPYLPRLARLMKDAADMGMATLGICLGSQVFARGTGAQNHIGTNPEHGWCAVELTEAGRADPLFAALPPVFRSMQSHSDSFALPAGATHLARSPGAEMQAFRFGRAGYATQFHFEANSAVVADWMREFPDAFEAAQPGFIASYPTMEAAHAAEADAFGLTIARAFVALI